MTNGKIQITVTGNLTADPELRFTPNGTAVANFVVASTPRIWDQQANEWKDGDASFMRTSVWYEQAENVAESFRKGDRVVVTGVLGQRHWVDETTGDKKSMWEMRADEVAASVRYARVKIAKMTRRTEPGTESEQQNG